MTAEEKLIQLAGQLLSRARDGKVNWKYDYQIGDYYVKLSFGYLSISIRKSDTVPDVARLAVYRKNLNEPVIEIFCEETESRFDLLNALFDEADRKVRGWDEVLEKLEQELESGDEIGADPPPDPIREEDIPF